MKTNRISSIIRLCTILALVAACEKSSVLPDNDRSTEFTVRLHIGGISTRTSGSSTIADTEAESKISSLRLFLVSNDTDKKIKELSDFTADEENPLIFHAHLSPSDYQGNWLAYMVANWPSSIELNTSTYDDFIGSYTALTNAKLADMWKDDYFPMVNVCNPDDTNNGGVPVTLSSSNVTETPVADITLERIAAKVRASVDPYITYGIMGTQMGASTAVFGVSKVVFDGVAMINNVNSFNLIQKWTSGSPAKLVSPSSATDYNMSSGYYNTSVPPSSWSTPGTIWYCLENNAPDYEDCGGTHLDASEGTRMKGRVTGLLIRAQVQTLSYFKSEADTDPDTDGAENLLLDPDEGIWTRAAETDAAFRTFYKYKGIYFADWQQLFAQNPSLGSTESDADPDELRSKGVAVYEDGYMYYTYWIETEGDMYVARNVFYDLSIKSVNAFGDDLPGGAYSSGDPIKTDDPKITLSLKISDWDEKTDQDYTL